MSSPRLSPDGARLAGSTGNELQIVSLAGEPRIELPTDAAETVVGWSAVGEDIYTFGRDAARILRHSTSGSDVEIVADADCDAVVSMSEDAARFLCVGYEIHLDLWVVRDIEP
jgi:hypothetical protein